MLIIDIKSGQILNVLYKGAYKNLVSSISKFDLEPRKILRKTESLFMLGRFNKTYFE